MTETFELWAHRELGELYAIRRVAGRVAGVCGPIPRDMIGIVDLSGCRYQDPQEALRWRGAGAGEFIPAQCWALGFENRAVILGALARAAGASAPAPHP